SGGKESVRALFDSLIFDGFASAIIPSTLTVYVIRITYVCLNEGTTVPDVVMTWGPTVIGLFMLSVTTEPVDKYISQALNDTVRKL
ncbi:unnamed protein product, partial [Candidula unifasciata]